MLEQSYTPPKKYLERYADVLINFGLGGGKGVKRGEVVSLLVPEVARPLYAEIYRAVIKAGAYPLVFYTPSASKEFNPTRELLEHAPKEVLSYTPKKFFEGWVEETDHILRIDGETIINPLKGIDPERIFMRAKAQSHFRVLYLNKELEKRLSWCIALYGTDAMAKEAGLTPGEYWEQIIKACYLDKKDPIAEWRRVIKDSEKVMTWLNSLSIESLRVVGPDCDLRLRIGADRLWDGGRGANIPSFEIFTSPDWRGTEGWVRFNQPLYHHDSLIEGIELEFKKGKVVRAAARKNEAALKALIAVTNGNRVGEFSLTDKRMSRITKFMAETLYDENMGGSNGNTHIALGESFKTCYRGKQKPKTDKEWDALGFNSSPVHSDIISTAPRTVTATFQDGSELVIYKDGKFTI